MSARTVPGEPAKGRETQFLRMICRALQDYGMIAVDGTTEDGLILMMENSETADWPEIVRARAVRVLQLDRARRGIRLGRVVPR